MQATDLSLLEFLLKKEVLQFGEFQTKSQRRSPYFFDTGRLNAGVTLWEVASHFVDKINALYPVHSFDALFGPAYKGIPLATAVACRYGAATGVDLEFAFDRKEAKDHGEGGLMVGHKLTASDRVIIIEDVLTGGTSLRQSIQMLKKQGVKVLGAIVIVDREEFGLGEQLASEEIQHDFGVPVHSLLKLSEIVNYLHKKPVCGKIWINDQLMRRIKDYQQIYGSP